MRVEITRDVAAKVLDVVDQGLARGGGKPIPGQMCVEAAVCYALGLPHGDDPGCVDDTVRSLEIGLNDANWSSDAARAKGMRRLALVQLGSKGTIDPVAFGAGAADIAVRVMVPIALRVAARRVPKHAEALERAAQRCEDEGTATNATNAAYAAYAANAANAAYAAYAAYAAATNAANAANAAYAAATNAANAAYAAATYAANVANAAATYAATYAANVATYAANVAAGAEDGVMADFAERVVQLLVRLKAPGCQWLDLAPLDGPTSQEDARMRGEVA